MSSSKKKNQRRRRNPRSKNLLGTIIRPSADPPSFVQLPWWYVTISDQPTVDSSQVKTYRGSDLWNLLQAQTGAASTTAGKASLVIFSVQVWNMSGTSLALDAYDLHKDTRTDILLQTEDVPGRNHWARLGYLWPKSQRANCIDASSDTVVCQIAAAQDTNLEVRFRIAWKPRGLSQPNDATNHLVERLERLSLGRLGSGLVKL